MAEFAFPWFLLGYSAKAYLSWWQIFFEVSALDFSIITVCFFIAQII